MDVDLGPAAGLDPGQTDRAVLGPGQFPGHLLRRRTLVQGQHDDGVPCGLEEFHAVNILRPAIGSAGDAASVRTPLPAGCPPKAGGERGRYGPSGAYCSAYLSTFSLVTTITGVRISWGTFSPFRARMAATTLQ